MESGSGNGAGRRLQWAIWILLLAVFLAALAIAAGRLVEWDRDRRRMEALAREKEALESEIEALDREIARPVDEPYIKDHTGLSD